MTRRRLEAVWRAKLDIREASEELEKLEHELALTGADPRDSDEWRELDIIIKGATAQYNRACRDVSKHIAEVSDPILKRALRLRCIHCLTWEQIAKEMDTTCESLRQMYSRYTRSVR